MSRTRLALLFPLLSLVNFLAPPMHAQSTGDLAVGLTPYQSFHGGNIDSINLQNGNLVLQIPLASYPQRGDLKIGFHFVANTKNTHTSKLCNPRNCTYFWVTSAPGVVEDEGVTIANQLYKPPNSSTTFSEFAVVTSDGAQHPVAQQITGDGTGFWTNTESNAVNPPLPTVIIDRNGVRTFLLSGAAGVLREDPNGNQIMIGSDGSLTDTMGRTFPFLKPGQVSIPGSSTTDFSGCTGPLPIASASSWSLPTLSGGTMTLKFCQVSVPINIPAQSPAPAFSGSQTATQSIVLPNRTAWTFAYDNYGLPSQITLPTGGTISYGYTTVNQSCGNTVNLSRSVTSRTVNANDGTGSHTWQYNYGAFGTLVTTVTDPLGNDTVHTYTSFGGTSNCYAFETETQSYQGSQASGTLLKTIQTDYNLINGGNPVYSSPGVLPIRMTTTWPTAQVTKVETDYDSNGPAGMPYGNVIAQREYDYGSSAPGALLRTTTTHYLAFSNSAYLTNNLVSLKSSAQVTDSSGTQRALTTYAYDESSLAPSGVTAQHDSSPPTGSTRGNLTSVSRWLNTTGGSAISHATYFDTGMVNTKTDANNNQTTVGYSAIFVGAYPTTVTNALGQATTSNYDFNTGLLTSVTDPNNQATTYLYDGMWRLSQVNRPDNGQDSITHQESSYPFTATLTTKINSSQNFVKTNVFDGLGRVTQNQLNSDPDCSSSDKTDTTYDGLGRVASVSNPYCTTSDPTYGLTTYAYDALGRTKQVNEPDGSVVITSYSGNCATVTDEAGKKRQSCSDGLGRLTQLTEDPGGLGYITNYTYDAFDNLLTAVQNGSRQRTFAYDSLSRLTSATNPESGTITYSYDANGNLTSKTAPAPNQTGTATVTTCFGTWNGSSCGGTGYDALNRLKTKSYSDTNTPVPTPLVSFNYDEAANWTPIANPIGRLTTMYTGNVNTPTTGAEYSYDPMGRTVLYAQCAPSNCGSSDYEGRYTYDLAGNMLSAFFYPGYTISYTYDTAGRPAQVTSNYVDSQHPTQHPATLATVDNTVGYWPNGALRKVALANGLYETAAYNKRLQPCRMNTNSTSTFTLTQCTDGAPSGNVLDFTYGYNGGANNGNIASWSAAGQQAFNRSYTYDSLNRIATMADSNSGQACKGMSWNIDPWGNLTNQTVTQGSCPTFQSSANTKNQLTGAGSVNYQYDAAGNMTYDGSHTYYYDAENRLIQVDGTLGTCSSATMCYVYDANGLRVRSTAQNGGSEWIHDLQGNVVSQFIINFGWGRGYVYLGSQQLAEYGDGTTYFIHRDHLSSTRLVTKLDGSTKDSYDYLPFGQITSGPPGGNSILHLFTGEEHDAETATGYGARDGFDYFGARYYASRMFRFTSPDPVGGYISNPQSLNRYAYVLNNPLSLVDPFGLDSQDPCHGTDRFCASTNANPPPDLGTGIPGGAGQPFDIPAPQPPPPDGGLVNTDLSSFVSGFIRDSGVGMVKASYNALADFDNWFYSGVNAALGTNFHVDEFEPSNPGEKAAMAGTSLALLFVPGTGEEEAAVKAANLPAWKTIDINMEHILSGHTEGGARVSSIKDLFPESMSAQQIENAIRQAYRYSTKAGRIKRGVVPLVGKAYGLEIKMYVNIAGKVIKTAWPVF